MLLIAHCRLHVCADRNVSHVDPITTSTVRIGLVGTQNRLLFCGDVAVVREGARCGRLGS